MILLSFDIEEFDVPRERGLNISLSEGVRISKLGTEKILDILKQNDVRATLFCTSNFVENATDVIKRAIDEGHEIACHGVDHWNTKADDPKISKEKIEKILDIKVNGFRAPRMFDVDDNLIKSCGYKYNSSLNPAFIPGKYMHLKESRTAFDKDGVLQIPASVTPRVRIPMFWLAMHTYPMPVYLSLANKIVNRDSYFMTYFHPWEFVNHPANIRKYMLSIVKHNSGHAMCDRLDTLIKYFKKRNQDFVTFSNFMLWYRTGDALDECKTCNNMSLL